MATTQAVVGMTDEEIDQWLEEARHDTSPADPAALSAEYIRSLDMVLVKIDNGERLTIPREQLQGLEGATPEQLASIEIIGTEIIGWPHLDVHHYLPNLIAGKYASERWKQARKRQQTVAA